MGRMRLQQLNTLQIKFLLKSSFHLSGSVTAVRSRGALGSVGVGVAGGRDFRGGSLKTNRG